MGRKPKVKTEKFDEKKMETVVDFGQIKVPTKWEDVTLQMLSDYLTLSKEKEDLLEKDKEEAKRNKTEKPNEKDDKYNITDKDLLQCFTDFPMEKYDILPVELYNTIMANFSFVLEEIPQTTPSNEITYNGMRLIINAKESLKVKEFEDAEMVLRSNMYDYPSLLAILCRKVVGRKTDNVSGLSWDVNEDYDSEFANKIFDARREMFAKMPVTEVMPLITFFLLRGLQSQQVSQTSITTLARQLEELVDNMQSSLKDMGYKRMLYLPQMIRLKRLKKSIRRFS